PGAGAVRRRELAAEPLRDRGRRWTRLNPLQGQRARRDRYDLGYRRSSRAPQPVQAVGLGLEEARRGVRLRRTGGRIGQGLQEDGRTVLKREAAGPADRATGDRSLADALVPEERGQLERMSSQIGQVHDAEPSDTGVRVSVAESVR